MEPETRSVLKGQKMGMEAQDELMADGSGSAERRSGAPRLFIKEMVMRNFKSYAGEQRVGPFHKVRVPLRSYPPPPPFNKFNFKFMQWKLGVLFGCREND